MRFGSLYAGVGGFDIGLEAAGMECAWQVEADEYATRVLEKHWPDVPRVKWSQDFPPEGDWSVDLLATSPPCQPVATCGERKGEDDERWLWPEVTRICEALGRPTWLLLENVNGLLSAKSNPMGRSGSLFGGILRDLAEIGYDDIRWDCISAAALGASHVRDRIFLLAHAGSWGHARPWEPFDASYQAAHGEGEANEFEHGCLGHSWGVEPELGRVALGVRNRAHRLRCLGNSICPPVAQWIGERIMECHVAIDNAAATAEGTESQRTGALGA
jgi:DNA (cytosine-5)-methyltransferase 1